MGFPFADVRFESPPVRFSFRPDVSVGVKAWLAWSLSATLGHDEQHIGEEVTHMNRNLVSLGLLAPLALVALLVNAQGPDSAVPGPLRSLRALIEAQYASNPISVAPVLAEEALLVDDVFVTPQDKVRVTLRNGGQRTITAWSLALVAGSDSGAARVSSFAVDKYTGLLAPNAPAEYSPLRPNETRFVEHDLPVVHQPDASGDARGNYSVVGVEVGAVILDDGTVAGRDVRDVLGFVLDRYARAAALSRLLDRVALAERAGELDQLLEDSLNSLAREQQAVAAAILDGPGPITLLDSQRQQDAILTQQWLQSLLSVVVRRASPPELEELGLGPTRRRAPEFLDLLRTISGSRPEMLRSAVDDTRPAYEAELDLLRDNMPASLRAEIDGLASRVLER